MSTMIEVREEAAKVEKALLVGCYFHRREEEEAQSLMLELHELVTTLGVAISDHVLVRISQMSARHLMGSGKAKEIMDQAKFTGCDIIIFDNELSPAQQRAWEKESGITVIDRHEVILDIFNQRARSREARLQVDLARMQYALPRLKRLWSHLDRQGGAGGGASAGAARGEGETQLEVDRRLARKKIDKIKAELMEVRRQRETQRKERLRNPIPHAAIVGYTNAGKSTLLNALTGADILAEDKLFATLDPTTRRFDLPDGQSMLLTDTVGFVRRLPHALIEAFKATLEEAALSDFLIHVLDASQPRVKEFYQTTMEVLEELEAADRPTVIVLNKIDLVSDPDHLRELQQLFPDAVQVSVTQNLGMELLISKINDLVLDRVERLNLRIPQYRMDRVAVLHQDGKILQQSFEDNDILIQAIVPRHLKHHFQEFIVPNTK